MFVAVGVFLLVMGTLWVLQGLGLLGWPPGSFMLDRWQWALYGAITTAVGVGLIWLGRGR
ncbi:MAG: hypothetical protein OHK0018_02450 [Erythrobacter tepidarius]